MAVYQIQPAVRPIGKGVSIMAITQNGKPVVGNVRDTEALFLLRWRLPDGKYEVERAPGCVCGAYIKIGGRLVRV
jgi:hypothetical protein